MLGFRGRLPHNQDGTEEENTTPRETLSTRVTRLEELHADRGATVKILLDAQIKTETRFQELDDRIGKLVSAIGELIRRMPAK